MFGDTTKTVRVPLSQYTIGELHARATELKRMSASANTTADMQAMEALAVRFDALADRHEAEDAETGAATGNFSRRFAGVEQLGADEHVTMLGPDRPMGLPSAQAMQIATDAVCRHYVVPETMQHPAVLSQCRRFAYLLMAYGLVPTKPAAPTAQSIISAKPLAAQSRDTDHYVLVVDDVSDVLVTVGAFLLNAGFAVRKASSGDEALRLIAGNPQIDVLVTDFAMPGLSGVELIAQAAQIRPNLKALVITGYPNADGLAELPPHTTVLVKPFRRATLIAQVRSLLGEMQTESNETAELVDQREG